jgi:hypothetical protein
MSVTQRWILAIVLLVVMLLAGTVGVAGVTAVRHGLIRVQVDSGGPDGGQLDIAVPAALVELMILLTPTALLADEIPLHEIRPYLPMIRELTRQIEELPDGVFVQVSNPNETIHVEKKNDRFIIRVVTGQESINVILPISTVNRVMRKARHLI